MTKSFGDHVPNIEIFVACGVRLAKILYMSWQIWEAGKTIFLSGVSHVMVPGKLIEMVQYQFWNDFFI